MLHSDGGFTKFPNYLRDAPWRSYPNTVTVYFYLRMNANHFETSWNNTPLKPGELITGRKRIAEETGLSEQNVKTALNHLKSAGDITIRPTNKFSIISFTDMENWGVSDNSVTSEIASFSTSNQPTTSQQPTTEKYYNTKRYGENEREAPRSSPPSLDDVKTFFAQNNAQSSQAEHFFDYYEAIGWVMGGRPVVNWQAAARRWIARDANGEYEPYAGLPVYGSWDS